MIEGFKNSTVTCSMLGREVFCNHDMILERKLKTLRKLASWIACIIRHPLDTSHYDVTILGSHTSPRLASVET